MKRHIGKMANTDQRLVVVFMQIPGKEDHALVVPTDTLPARYEQAVMDILESPEGQAEETLANVLSRRLMPDTGKPVLVALHEAGMLKAIPIKNIMMMPQPNMPFPLSSILESLGRDMTVKEPSPTNYVAPEVTAIEKYNQIQVNQKIEGVENRRAIYQNLMIEAQLLDGEAEKKRQAAYKVCPEMAPGATPVLKTEPVVLTEKKKNSVRNTKPKKVVNA